MTITILKDNIRIASYTYKSKRGAKKTLNYLKAFYDALYSGKGVSLEYVVEGA